MLNNAIIEIRSNAPPPPDIAGAATFAFSTTFTDSTADRPLTADVQLSV
jgi:hypothetical protein